MKQFYLKCLLLGIFSLVGIKAAAYDCKVNGIYYNLDETKKTASVTNNSSSFVDAYSGAVTIPSNITHNRSTYSVTSIGSSANGGGTSYTSPQVREEARWKISRFNAATETQKLRNRLQNRLTYLNEIVASYPVPEDGDDGEISETKMMGTMKKSVNVDFWSGYSQSGNIQIDKNKLASLLAVESINDYRMKLVPLNFDSSEGTNTSAGTYGAWFDENGDTNSWGNGHVYIESNNLYRWDYGCHPGNCSPWDGNHTASMQYQYNDGGILKLVNIVVTFNIQWSSNDIPKYVKLTAEDGTVSWIEINGIINGNNIEIYKGGDESAIDVNIVGSIDLEEVWSESGGKGTHYRVTSIGETAFYDCRGLTSIVIPTSVTEIEGSAFSGCSGLTSIVIESGNTVYDSRDNCNAIIETASNTLITGCKNTMIPSSVTSIGDGAFDGCSGLTSIEIPSSVTSIGSQAFFCCSGLISITSYITEIFETELGAFSGCDNVTLYVRKGLVNTYQSKADWNRIKKIEEIPCIVLAMSCNNKGKVLIDGTTEFTNNMDEVNVYDGAKNTFVFTPEENCQLEQVLIDGLDVTLSVKNNQLTTKIRENSKMIVTFSKSSGDMNGDGMVNISDVVALVNLILGQ